MAAYRRYLLTFAVSVLAWCVALPAWAAPSAELWPRWQQHGEQADPDYAVWQDFLDRHVEVTGDLHVVDYAAARAELPQLEQALQQWQAVHVSTLRPQAQKAYWINLYNFATVVVVLRHWPVDSIRDIRPRWWQFGPWSEPLLKIEGEPLSLNDIEHRILRPIFRDPRIHYAVNCASIGCPNLSREVYRSDILDAQLDAQAKAYIASERGLHIEGASLRLSSIYDWFAEDFASPDEPLPFALLRHLANYAEGERRAELEQRLAARSDGRPRLPDIDYAYDWRINARDGAGAEQ